MAASVLRPIEQSSAGQPPDEPATSEPTSGTSGAVNQGASTDEPPTGVQPTDTYRFAIDEYRFQAQYNWSRTQYLLAFNAAVLAAACGLFVPAGIASALVFALGAVAAVSSQFVLQTQHRYYRAARDRLRRVEIALAVPDDLRFDTTKGLGGTRSGPSVNFVIHLLLVAIATADVTGIVLALIR